MSALDWDECSASLLGLFTSGERALGPYWIGGWVGPRTGLDSVEERKISYPCRDLNSGPPVRGPSLYRLSYRGWCKYSSIFSVDFIADLKVYNWKYNIKRRQSSRLTLSRVWVTIDGVFGLNIGIAENLQVVTTNKYICLKVLHTPNIIVTAAHINSSQSSQDVSW
jgi:hypothetical protein